MLEFIPEKVGQVVILNVIQPVRSTVPIIPPVGGSMDSFVGSDFVVAIHNWLIGTQLKYLVFDLQDEKEVPPDFLEELMQLMKRVKIPFLFTGVMDKPKALLKSYNYNAKFPIFSSAEEAIDYVVSKYSHLLSVNHDGITFGTPIEMVRSRLNGKQGEEDGEVPPDEED